MQQKASALIAILQSALARIEADSQDRAGDPDVIELKNSILRGIASLEAVCASVDQPQAA